MNNMVQNFIYSEYLLRRKWQRKSKKQEEDKFFQQEMKKKSCYRNIDSREEVEFEIKEMQLDKICDLFVGGYVE